ncbi:MAG: PLP-dependent transferase, partial [Pirellulaceae bacterium]
MTRDSLSIFYPSGDLGRQIPLGNSPQFCTPPISRLDAIAYHRTPYSTRSNHPARCRGVETLMNETDPTGKPIPPDKLGSSDSTPRSSSKRRLPTPHAAPLVLASVWQMESPEQAADILAGQSPGYAYRRDGHPNADQLVEQLKGLHQADWAILTAQGMSSLAALALATLEPGDLVLLAQPLYGRTSTLFEGELARFGIRTLSVPAVDLACWKEAMGSRPKMAIAET